MGIPLDGDIFFEKLSHIALLFIKDKPTALQGEFTSVYSLR